jgi:nucleotide-binding universal stress UspA family protein
MNIVVGFVNTAEGRAALARAIEEARLREAKLVVVRSTHGRESDEDVVTYQEELSEVDRQLTQAGIPHSVHYLARGNSPSEDLVEVASEEKAEMIVIGLRRRSPVGKALLGSNAQGILLDADCPVLAVKASK